MNLKKVCNNIAANVLGTPGTIVQEVYGGVIIEKPFEVVGLGNGSGEIEVYCRGQRDRILGSFNATDFKKAEQ